MKLLQSKARTSVRAGAALVIVLAFVVLLSALIIAFLVLSTTERQLANSSVTTAKADQLASSALSLVVGDLKQEIANGSTYVVGNAGSTTNYEPVYSTNIAPRLSGISALTTVPDPIPNLVRISMYQDASGTPSAAAPLVGSQASNLSSTTPSLNGRSISLKTWNQHYLLPRSSPGSATFDPTPTSTFVAPDWVFVTSQGRQVISTPSKSVIGRYAYAIYDEGGLLNLNAAGYPTTGTLAQIGGKGNIAYADLTMLTNGATSVTSVQINQVINTLVGWRNYATAQPSGDFAGGFTFSASSANSYISNIVATNAASGYLKVASMSTANGNTDQAFLTRQELIDFWTTKNFPPDLLQYVCTFSRDTNAAPTWTPLYDASTLGGSSTFNYKSNAGNTTTPPLNPDILNWRFSANTTLANYDLSGNQTSVLALKGDPIVRRRFCLQRINLLTYQGPNANIPNAAAAIKQYFGLVWGTDSSGQSCWIYTSASPSHSISNLPTSIMSLASVAAENREPDFFELLQAGILNGSLGLDAGAASNGSTTGPAGETHLWDQTVGYQILQIGADIIDQYTSDNYPSEIAANFNFGPLPGTPPSPAGTLGAVYGIKNLPYLYAVYLALFRYQNPDPHAVVGAWFIPEVWNPHQQPTTAITPGPTQFRFVGSGTAQMQIACPTPNNPRLYSTTAPSYTTVNGSTVNLGSDTSGVIFKGTINDTEPVLIDQSTGTSTNPNDVFTTAQMTFTTGWLSNAPPGGPGFSTSTYTSNSHNHVGLFAGNVTDPLPAYDNDTNIAFYTQATLTPNSDTFYLQYLDSEATPVWRTYSEMKGLQNSTESGSYADIYSNLGGDYVAQRSDPRTDRFSTSEGYQGLSGSPGQTNGFSLPNKTLWVNCGVGGEPSIRYTPSNPNFMFAGTIGTLSGVINNYNNPWQLSENRNPPTMVGAWGGTEYYFDLDGITRRAEGAYAGTGQVDGHPLNTGNSASRPVVLCRPFRNVGEMGYAFRDLPWKNIDFFTPESADSALLDLFTVDDVDDVAMTAGRVNLNTRQAPVLAALLNGATEIEPVTSASTLINATDAKNLATAICNASETNPFVNRAQLVNRFKSPNDVDTRTFISSLTSLPFASTSSSPDPNRIKSQRESIVRSLADATTTRTWNLMIDVIAQTGHYPPGSTLLSQFVVDGERRYWLHIAIDRYTGNVIDSVLEPVYD